VRAQRDWLGLWSAEPGSPGPTPRYCVSTQIAGDFHDIMHALGENSLVLGREREIAEYALCRPAVGADVLGERYFQLWASLCCRQRPRRVTCLCPGNHG
jgi:hypothetical protein